MHVARYNFTAVHEASQNTVFVIGGEDDYANPDKLSACEKYLVDKNEW